MNKPTSKTMEANPSEVFLLQKIDRINLDNHNQGAPLGSILDGMDDKYKSIVEKMLKKFQKIGVVDFSPGSGYRLTGSFESPSDEVKHYIKHRTIPDEHPQFAFTTERLPLKRGLIIPFFIYSMNSL